MLLSYKLRTLLYCIEVATMLENSEMDRNETKWPQRPWEYRKLDFKKNIETKENKEEREKVRRSKMILKSESWGQETVVLSSNQPVDTLAITNTTVMSTLTGVVKPL